MILISKKASLAILAAAIIGMTTNTYGDAQWTGGGGDDLWTTAANWDTGAVPASATDRDNGDGSDDNVARFPANGTTTLIDSSVNATTFAIALGHEIPGTLGPQSASNTLNMTGGTLTQQGNFLFNVGRGRNADPNMLVQFNVSGGVVNSSGITIPEAFDGSNVLGFTSVGINAEMHVSGNAVVNTDLLRLGARDANSTLTISGNGVVNLNDNNNGFANGQLWLESFEFDPTADPIDLSGVTGTSSLDISDNGVLVIEGGVNNIQDDQAASLAVINDVLIPQGWITADGGTGTPNFAFDNGVIAICSDQAVCDAAVVPEPAGWALLLCVAPIVLRLRRKR